MAAIIEELGSIDWTSFTSEEDRKKAVAQVRALLARVESPWETACRLVLAMPMQLAALKVASDLDLFQKWLGHNRGEACSLDRLSEISGCSHHLLKRLLDHLAATHMIDAMDDGRFSMGTFSTALVEGDYMSFVECAYHFNIPLALHMPAFLKGTDHQNPTGKDGKDCCQQWCGKTLWEYFASNPESAASLARNMKATAGQRGNFADMFPCEDVTCELHDPLIVDIGGSTGHDLRAFRKRYPQATGRLVLQDKPEVIQSLEGQLGVDDDTIQKMGYDFFTPQPVQGARLYLLHSVLHDWSDEEAVKILEMVRPALKRGHSRLLIHELVLPLVKPVVEETASDLVMLYVNSGSERNENQWQDLINSAGMKVVKIWRNPVHAEAVIEVDLAS